MCRPAAYQYRFDWDADGTWDTGWLDSTAAQHRYDARARRPSACSPETPPAPWIPPERGCTCRSWCRLPGMRRGVRKAISTERLMAATGLLALRLLAKTGQHVAGHHDVGCAAGIYPEGDSHRFVEKTAHFSAHFIIFRLLFSHFEPSPEP